MRLLIDSMNEKAKNPQKNINEAAKGISLFCVFAFLNLLFSAHAWLLLNSYLHFAYFDLFSLGCCVCDEIPEIYAVND